MRRSIGLAVLMVAATASWAAAPPGQPRALTAEEEKEVAALEARLGRHAAAGEFEEAAKVAGQVAAYRRQRQGAGHWQAVDAAFGVEAWRRLGTIPAGARAEAARARGLRRDG